MTGVPAELRYSSPSLAVADIFQDPQWMPEAMNNTQPYIYTMFFPYIHTYDKV